MFLRDSNIRLNGSSKLIIGIVAILVIGAAICVSFYMKSTQDFGHKTGFDVADEDLLSGITTDNALSLVIRDIQVLTTTHAEALLSGSFQITNLTSSSIPTSSIAFGVLDKETNFIYWGSVGVNVLGNIQPHEKVNGTFSVQFYNNVDLKKCNLVFGFIPKVTFEAPIPIEK